MAFIVPPAELLLESKVERIVAVGILSSNLDHAVPS